MLRYSTQCIDKSDIESVINALKGDTLTQGTLVERFERALSSFVNTKYAIVFNSATSALFCAYNALNLKRGDEVITTPLTFASTNTMILSSNAKPVFCDIASDGNIDTDKIEPLINSNTRAIVSVDYAGNPADAHKINAIAKEYNLKSISDSSHALGSEINGCRVGSSANINIFSFHAIKPITTGEGGAILTDDRDIFERATKLRSHNIYYKELWDSDIKEIGYNFRLSEINSALGISQIKKIDHFMQKRERIASFYDDFFDDFALIKYLKIKPHIKSSRHLYPIFLPKSLQRHKKDIYKSLNSLGIETRVHYKPSYKFSVFNKYKPKQELHQCEDFYNSVLSIPIHQQMSVNDASRVTQTLQEIISKYI